MGPGYWAEPVNAVTNLVFVIAALVMWRRCTDMPMGRVLALILGAIGIGSYLFHTHAQVWAAIADVAPIATFILVYLFAINRDVWGLQWGVALGATALFIPYAALTIPIYAQLPVLGVSAGYIPVPVLILIYAWALRHRARGMARGFVLGAGLLFVSLASRSIDETLCARFPLGTHFLWHLLNGVMLGWMIEVYRRYRVAQA